jgi:hypothetical protein
VREIGREKERVGVCVRERGCERDRENSKRDGECLCLAQKMRNCQKCKAKRCCVS